MNLIEWNDQHTYIAYISLLSAYSIFITNGFEVILQNIPPISFKTTLIIELLCFVWKIIIIYKLFKESSTDKKEKKVSINSQLETHIYDSTQNLAEQDCDK